METRATAEERAAEGAPAAPSAASDRDDGGLLCDRIDDDEALTPAGAEPLDIPGLREANNERRCIFAFGVDMEIAEVRDFYRSALRDLEYEIVRYDEAEGIARGNLSRTFLRATKPGLQVNLQADEFDPEESGLSEHRVNVKLQFDVMRR